MKNKRSELIIFGIVAVFVFFSNRLDPKITLTITGILLVGIFVYRATLNKKENDK